MEKAKSPVKVFINKYGWEEYYEQFYIEHLKTGHIHRDNDCGTCDGGCCRACSDLWRVGELGVTELFPYVHTIKYENFWSEKEEALKLYESLCKKGEWPE